MNRLERDIPTPEDLHDTIVRLTALVEQQEAEIDRLRKIAHWHDTPRVRIKRLHDYKGREGHAVKKFNEETLVMLDGALIYHYFPNDCIEYIGTRN